MPSRNKRHNRKKSTSSSSQLNLFRLQLLGILRTHSRWVAFSLLVVIGLIFSVYRGSALSAVIVVAASALGVIVPWQIRSKRPLKIAPSGILSVNLVGLEKKFGTSILMHKDQPLSSIQQEIAKKTRSLKSGTQMTFLFAGRALDVSKTLHSCGIDNDSVLMVLLHEDGVSHAEVLAEEKKAEEVPVPDEVTESERAEPLIPAPTCWDVQCKFTWGGSVGIDAPDMITLESGPEKRYDMMCGKECGEQHGLTQSSLLEYIQHCALDGKYELECPKCHSPWHYPFLRKVLRSLATFTPDIRQNVEEKLSANLVRQKMNAKRCGSCSVILRRSISNMSFEALCVGCRGRRFCWACTTPWTKGSVACSNAKCPSWIREVTCKLLEKCPTKPIDHMPSVPVLRACPTCGQLITHISDCKHMDCPICNKSFCFICVLPTDENENYQCGYNEETCPLADRQTKEKLIPTGLRSYSNVLSIDDDSTDDISTRDQDARIGRDMGSAQFYDEFAQKLLDNLEAAGWNGYDDDY